MAEPWSWRHNGHTGIHERYKLSCAEFEQLVARSEGRCERCGTPNRRPVIDHDHALNWRAVRGLLCKRCNALIAAVDRGGPADHLSEAYLGAPFHTTIPPNRPRRSGAHVVPAVCQTATVRRPPVEDCDSYILGVRASSELRDAARDALEAHGWKLQEFITACLHAVAAEPEAVLRTLRPQRPAPKPKGRPRKGGQGSEAPPAVG